MAEWTSRQRKTDCLPGPRPPFIKDAGATCCRSYRGGGYGLVHDRAHRAEFVRARRHAGMALVSLPILETAAGVCVVRDAVDLMPFLCGHYLRMGFAHLAFVDDGSSDGTFEALTKLAKRTGRLSVRRVYNDVFKQRELVTEAANALLADGYGLIVPFDADEFWTTPAQEFERLSAGNAEAVFHGRWVNFVQARGCNTGGSFALFRMSHRAPEEIEDRRETVIGYTGSFVCFRETKIAFKATGPVQIDIGQHKLLGGPTNQQGPRLEIFHLPLRSRAEISKRALNHEPRRSPVRPDEGWSWQSAFHRQAVMNGKEQAVWAANSFDRRGCLDVYGAPLALVPDARLRRLLLAAAWHLFSRYGLVAL